MPYVIMVCTLKLPDFSEILSIYPSIHPFIHPPTHLSIHPPIHPAIYPPIHPSIYVSTYLSIISLSLNHSQWEEGWSQRVLNSLDIFLGVMREEGLLQSPKARDAG
jgi:hypothetical protein